MSLCKITFCALILTLVSTQISTACDETNTDLREFSTLYSIEGNKSLCHQIDQISADVATFSAWKTKSALDQKTVHMLKGAVALPLGVGFIAACRAYPHIGATLLIWGFGVGAGVGFAYVIGAITVSKVDQKNSE